MATSHIQPVKVSRIASGWAAFGCGWAVHAPTRELVLKEYKERVKFYEELSKRPDPQPSQESAYANQKTRK